MTPTDAALLKWFNTKLGSLYNDIDHNASGTEECALGVCLFLRTFKDKAGTYDFDLDPPELVHTNDRDRYLFNIKIKTIRSPAGLNDPRADDVRSSGPEQHHQAPDSEDRGTTYLYSFKVRRIHGTYRSDLANSSDLVPMNVHELCFRDAEIQTSEPNGPNKSELLPEGVLHEYMQRLHEGGLSALLAQSCPIHLVPTPKPRIDKYIWPAIEIFVSISWLYQATEEVYNFDGMHEVLHFEGLPSVSFSSQSGVIVFTFRVRLDLNNVTGGGPDSVKFISVSFAIMTTFKTEGALDIWKIDQYSTRPSYIGPSLPSVVSDMTDIIKTIANEYIPSLWRLGFHVIYASLDWDAVTQCVVSPPPSGADQSGVTSGGPLMYGWDFVMAIPQESINTHYKGRVEYHFKKPGKGEGEVIHNGLRCTTLRIELLSHEHAIFWVSIDRITHSRPNDEGWSVRPFRLAFHTKLGMRIAPASYTSATGYSVWEVYIDTSADVSFLPQYSALSHGIYNIVDLVKSEFIPFLTKDKHNVIAHVPVLLAAVEGSTSPYAMKNAKFCTTFSCNIESVTKENWHKTITGRRRAAAPILLIYGKQPGADRTPCIPPSWGPYAFQTKYGNGLSTGTVAIAKDTYIRYVIPAQLARLNDITALVPTIQLACNCSCDDVVYLESSGDGLKATAEMWKPDTARPWSSQTYTFEFERTSSCDVQTVIDEVRKIKKLYECKTSNTLTISDRAILGAGPTANIKGNIELRCIESKATARLTWTWNVIPDTDVDVPSVETLLASVMTIPSPAESMVRGDVRAEDESDKESRILAKRLKDAFRAVVQRAKLPIPIAGIPAVAKACGHLDHDKTVRCNENGDLVLGVYPRTENSAETPSILR